MAQNLQNRHFEMTNQAGLKFQVLGTRRDKEQSHKMGFLRENQLKPADQQPCTGLPKSLMGRFIADRDQSKYENKFVWASPTGLSGSLLLHKNCCQIYRKPLHPPTPGAAHRLHPWQMQKQPEDELRCKASAWQASKIQRDESRSGLQEHPTAAGALLLH